MNKEEQIRSLTDELKAQMMQVVDQFVEESGPDDGKLLSLQLVMDGVEDEVLELLAQHRENRLANAAGLIAVTGQAD